METIDINLDELDPIQINFSEPVEFSSSSSSNFGSGIELLMNDKVKNSDFSTTIDMKDLDDIETELNDLSVGTETARKLSGGGGGRGGGGGNSSETKSISGMFGSFFGGGSKNGPSENNIRILTEDATDSRLGQDTIETIGGNRQTWDGYSKINEVPQRNAAFVPTTLSERERRRKKRTMLRNLDDWYEKGLIKTPNRFTIDSNYEEIEDEYEGALEDKRKRDSVKIQQNWMITMVNTIEYGNAFLNPFDVNLDGWGESVSEDIDSYDEIFEQLYEKYKGGKMSPELSLLLKLAFSASVIHFSNTSLSRVVPGFGDVMRQNPGLMKMFTSATVDSMKKTSPGMAFASELLNNNKPSQMTGPPPVPIETRNQPAPPRPGMQFTTPSVSNRPDISMGRGAMFREQGVDTNQGYQSVSATVQQPTQPTQPPQPPQPAPVMRPEMSGPKISDIDSILSGLKTKTVNIREAVTSARLVAEPTREESGLMMQPPPRYDENDSVISIASMKDMQNATMPKRSNRRKPKSDKNVISLDI